MYITKIISGEEDLVAIVVHEKELCYTNKTTKLALDQQTLLGEREESSHNWIKFITKDSELMQLGFMKRPKGHKVEPHLHDPSSRIVDKTSEFLQILKGQITVILYDIDNEVYQSNSLEIELHKGSSIILYRGAHSFEFTETSMVMEVKQGPYTGDLEKVFK